MEYYGAIEARSRVTGGFLARNAQTLQNQGSTAASRIESPRHSAAVACVAITPVPVAFKAPCADMSVQRGMRAATEALIPNMTMLRGC